MAYDLTNLTGSEGIGKVGGFLNEVTFNFFWVGVMISIFFIIILVLKNYPLEHGFFVSSWVCFVLSVILVSIGYLNLYVALAFLAMSGLSVLYLYLQGGF